MSKKILTVLAPVAAIVAFMAVPSFAQATTQLEAQCGAAECANGAAIRGQASQLKMIKQTPGKANGELHCPAGGEAAGTVTNNQGAHITSSITSFTLPQNCTQNGVSMHITTNASAAEPWTLQIQQPDAAGNGVWHISPFPGKKIQLSIQIQVFGGSVATCHFAANTVQGTYSVQNDVLTIDKTNAQFELESAQGFAAGECGTVGAGGTVGHLEGTIQLETAGAAAVVVHHV